MNYEKIFNKVKKELKENEIVNFAFYSKMQAYVLIYYLSKEFNLETLPPDNDRLMYCHDEPKENDKYVIGLRRKNDRDYVLCYYSYIHVPDKDLANEYWDLFGEKILYLYFK